MKNSQFLLEGQVALVTGASRGMGKAIARLFAEAGADVIVNSRSLADLEKVTNELDKLGRKSVALAADVGKMDDLKNLVDRANTEFGHIDILVNNAATEPSGVPALELEDLDWDRTMNVNFKGLFFLSQGVARIMIRQGQGSIINIASCGGIIPVKGQGIYCASKAAVIFLTKVMAAEWGEFNIRVNAIAPGLVATRLNEEFRKNKDFMDAWLGHTPLRRIGQPEDVARAALFLASEASSFMTGDTVLLDGGYNVG